MRVLAKLLFLLIVISECFASDSIPIRPKIYYDDPSTDVTLSIHWDGSFVFRSRTFELNEVEDFFNGFIRFSGKTQSDDIFATLIVDKGAHLSQVFDLIAELEQLNFKKFWLLEELDSGKKRWIEIIPYSFETLNPDDLLQSKHSSVISFDKFVNAILNEEDLSCHFSYRNHKTQTSSNITDEGSNMSLIDLCSISDSMFRQIQGLVLRAENFIPWIGPDKRCFIPWCESDSCSERESDFQIIWAIKGIEYKFEASFHRKEAHFWVNEELFKLSLTDIGRNRAEMLWQEAQDSEETRRKDSQQDQMQKTMISDSD